MLRVALVNMPFAALPMPSLALTQLQAVLAEACPDTVQSEVHYLNLDFGRYFGARAYQSIAQGGVHLYSGLGDWIFRHIAFPEAADNSDSYFTRFYRQHGARSQDFEQFILGKRRGMDAFLDDLIDKYALDRFDVLGFTSMFAQHVGCIALARKLKARNPALLIGIGGANCEAPMGPALLAQVPVVDIVFSGPALHSFPEWVRRLAAGVADPLDPPINGVFGRSFAGGATGAIVYPPRDVGEERGINRRVPLAYDAFIDRVATEFPRDEVAPIVLFETSRGCWWGQKAHCTFCGLNGSTMSYRSMTPDSAVQQFEELFRYADRCSHFESVDNILPKSYVRDVLPRLTVPEHVSIFYEVKADLTEEDFEALVAARVTLVQPGIESLATSTLKLMRKGTSAFTNVRFLLNAAAYGVKPAWNLLMGFPGEGAEVFEKYLTDLPRLLHLPPPTGAFPVRFDRYSPYFEQAREYGLDLKPMEMYGFVYPFEEATLSTLAYYFSDQNYASPYQADVARMLPSVRNAVASWQSRHAGKDGGVPADLFFAPSAPPGTVEDSRSGAVVQHHLTPVMGEILTRACTPIRCGDLAAALGRVGAGEIDAALDYLRERKLIFEEGDRLLNLVLRRPRSITPHESRRPA